MVRIDSVHGYELYEFNDSLVRIGDYRIHNQIMYDALRLLHESLTESCL